MSRSVFPIATLEEWVAREAIGFDLASTDSSNAAVDGIVGVLGGSVELLGLGEPTHGVENFLVLRNRVFERLVEVHGFSAIAIESSFPRGRLVNEYVAGRSAASIEEVLESGTSHGFGRLAANRQLVEWMREYNADASHAVKLGFYGFDAPMEMMGADSPRQLLELVLDYLADGEAAAGSGRRERIESLLGEEAAWSNPAAAYEPAKSVGLSANAIALQQETELLIHELQARGEELKRVSAADYDEAMHYALHARRMLEYRAEYARTDIEMGERLRRLLGRRDAMMAENLAYIGRRESGRVLAFAHNSHLKCGEAEWQLGAHALKWKPAGWHKRETLGDRYAVIGVGVGASVAMNLGVPEGGTLEALLTSVARRLRLCRRIEATVCQQRRSRR